MNKVEFIDAVIKIHEIANRVEDEFGSSNLTSDLRNCAERLHLAVLGVRIAEAETKNLINKAKE